MGAQTFGPLRSRAGKKPDSQCPRPVFWRCSCCGAVLHMLETPKKISIDCCSQPMEKVYPLAAENLPQGIALQYKIVGGPNENAIQVFFSRETPPEWLYLKTFTGGQFKYLSDKKHPPVVFALADEDAYVYCDKDPCEECAFRCKRGFILYGWFHGAGLYEYPLERMSANWWSKENDTNDAPSHTQ